MKSRFVLMLTALAFVTVAALPATKNIFVVQSAFAAEEETDEDEECPAGFEESEEKCTPEERENGCKDIRLDNGKGCVDRD